MPKTSPPLADLIPPLICGTGTFNTQYNPDPFALPAADIVARALSLGVRAFDTSPYYGPSEEILGQALDTPFVHDNFSRRDYFLVTKAGRISSSHFDYSPASIRQSVERSLLRLRTDYLDVVYCHDVEFVSPEEVLEAVAELRKIRDESGAIKYVGISGYPVPVLCELAELILERTGEPLDAVMSYANFTLQNSTLLTSGLARLQAAGVGVVPNASILGMGLLRRKGVPVGSQGDWHPTPPGLRAVARKASEYCDAQGDALEKVAIRYSVEGWLRAGAPVGTRGDPASGIPGQRETIEEVGDRRLGISVIGVSSVPELDETMSVWRSILDTMDGGKRKGVEKESDVDDYNWGLERWQQVLNRAQGVRDTFGEWLDYAWDSPPRGFVHTKPKEESEAPKPHGKVEEVENYQDFDVMDEKMSLIETDQIPTPGASPPQVATLLAELS